MEISRKVIIIGELDSVASIPRVLVGYPVLLSGRP